MSPDEIRRAVRSSLGVRQATRPAADTELRLECLRLAMPRYAEPHDRTLARASAFADFVLNAGEVTANLTFSADQEQRIRDIALAAVGDLQMPAIPSAGGPQQPLLPFFDVAAWRRAADVRYVDTAIGLLGVKKRRAILAVEQSAPVRPAALVRLVLPRSGVPSRNDPYLVHTHFCDKQEALGQAIRVSLALHDVAALVADPFQLRLEAMLDKVEGIGACRRAGYLTTLTMSPAMRRLAELLAGELLRHTGQQTMDEQIANVGSREDRKGNVYPNSIDGGHIDGPVALLMAIAADIEESTPAAAGTAS